MLSEQEYPRFECDHDRMWPPSQLHSDYVDQAESFLMDRYQFFDGSNYNSTTHTVPNYYQVPQRVNNNNSSNGGGDELDRRSGSQRTVSFMSPTVPISTDSIVFHPKTSGVGAKLSSATSAPSLDTGFILSVDEELNQIKRELQIRNNVVDVVAKLMNSLKGNSEDFSKGLSVLQQFIGKQVTRKKTMTSSTHTTTGRPDLTRYKKENAANNLKYKTSMCQHYEKKGKCPLGDDCQFAHGLNELRVISGHPLYKTRVCRLHTEQRHCPYGDRCYYYHDEQERAAMLRPKLETCSQPHLAGYSHRSESVLRRPHFPAINRKSVGKAMPTFFSPEAGMDKQKDVPEVPILSEESEDDWAVKQLRGIEQLDLSGSKSDKSD